MKQNRTNNNKYIFLIFLAIYFLATGGINYSSGSIFSA